jgi:hypothetical protein
MLEKAPSFMLGGKEESVVDLFSLLCVMDVQLEMLHRELDI